MSAQLPNPALPNRRRRGAMFTIMVLVTSTILLSVGGAFVDSTRNLTKHAGLADRQEQAKEALAGAAEWARDEVTSSPGERRAAHTTLKLSRASVALTLDSTADGVSCEAVATVKPDVQLAASIRLVRRNDRWVVSSFAIKPAP